MIIIYPDNYVTDLSADEENANYPVSNLSNNYASEVWKATSADAVLTFLASANANILGIARTNATSVTVTVYPSGSINWSSDSDVGISWSSNDNVGVDWLSGVALSEVTYDISSSEIGQLIATWTGYSYSVVVDISFSAAAGTIIEAGALRCGLKKTYRDPVYSPSEGLNDYSTRMRLDSGGMYVEKGDSERTMNFRVFESRSNIWDMMYDVFQLGGPGPYFFRVLSDKLTDWEWIMFAWLDESMPNISHDFPSSSYIEISLVEAI